MKYIYFTLSKQETAIPRTRGTINQKNMKTLANSLYTLAADPLNCWTPLVVASSLEAVITDASVTLEETVSQEPKLFTTDQQQSILRLQAWLGLHTHWFTVRVVHPRAAKSGGRGRFSVPADERSALENMAVVILRFRVRTRHGLTWVFGLTKGHFNRSGLERLNVWETSNVTQKYISKYQHFPWKKLFPVGQ